MLVVHPSLRLTMLVTPSTKPRVASELASGLLAHLSRPTAATGDVVIDRFQVLEVTSPDWAAPVAWTPEIMHIEAMDYVKALPVFLKALYGQGEGVNKFEGVPATFIMYDLFQSFIPQLSRQVFAELDRPVPYLLAFGPCNASAFWGTVVSAEKGGVLDNAIKRVAADEAAGLTGDELWAKQAYSADGEVKKVPGLPAKFDYEWHPLLGTIQMPGPVLKQVCSMLSAVQDKDTTAFVLPFVRELETEAAEASEAETGKELIMAGVQFPEPVWAGVKLDATTGSDDDRRVMAFLDEMEAKHGKDSVLYISFGSMFYPLGRPELVTWLIESLVEARMPFLFAHATTLAPADPALLAKIDAHADGCQVKFAPQWAVLEHDAVGFFLSHCGSNSSAEAVLARVPLVAMPFAADQGEYASLWTDVYGVCITLKQVFTFKNGNDRFHTLYDGTEIVGTEAAVKHEAAETWAALRGEQGKQMRANMDALRAKVEKSYREGQSRKAMLGFERFF
ncbi:hypothetical protein Q5752_003252 [Cryptotrichosporon argae]